MDGTAGGSLVGAAATPAPESWLVTCEVVASLTATGVTLGAGPNALGDDRTTVPGERAGRLLELSITTIATLAGFAFRGRAPPARSVNTGTAARMPIPSPRRTGDTGWSSLTSDTPNEAPPPPAAVSNHQHNPSFHRIEIALVPAPIHGAPKAERSRRWSRARISHRTAQPAANLVDLRRYRRLFSAASMAP